MEISKKYDETFTNKLSKFIKPEYLQTSQIFLEVNKSKGSSNSIKIKVDNNPWRNNQIKGDLIFAKIKSTGNVKYIAFKSKFDYIFNKLGISYKSIKSDNLYLRIDLNEFENYISNEEENAKKFLNSIFLDSISFPEFGCCSKYNKCTEIHKCLHNDPLYSTACQYKKIIERNDNNGNS